MQEQMPATEIPVHAEAIADPATTVGGNPALADPRALQILSTEHWSLLATRSLSYNETFARAGMFLTFLGASLVALGLVAATTGVTAALALSQRSSWPPICSSVSPTLGRIVSATEEEMDCVAGMNRIRHAYREMVPGIEPYFSTPFHDDVDSILQAYGPADSSPFAELVHGLTTAPAMIGVVIAVVAGALAASIVLGLGFDAAAGIGAGLVGFAIMFGLLTWSIWSSAQSIADRYEARIPGPASVRGLRRGPGPGTLRVPSAARPKRAGRPGWNGAIRRYGRRRTRVACWGQIGGAR